MMGDKRTGHFPGTPVPKLREGRQETYNIMMGDEDLPVPGESWRTIRFPS